MSNEHRPGVVRSEQRWEIFDSLPRPVRDALNYADGNLCTVNAHLYLTRYGIEQTVQEIKNSYPSKIRP